MTRGHKHFIPLWTAIIAVLLWFAPSPLSADVHVSGYTRKDGTYVAPYYRSDPNGTKNDNFSTKGNVNPYTGKRGTKRGDSPSGSASGTSGSGSANADTSGSDGLGSQVPLDRAVLWTRVNPKMTKEQVTKILGIPNAATSSKWLYTDGGKVTFDDDGLVATVSRAQ